MNEIVKIKIADIGHTVTGKTPSSNNPEDFGSEFMFVTPSDSFDSKMMKTTERYLSEEGVAKLSNKLLPPKSIMITCIGSAMGKTSMNKTSCVTNQQINSVVPSEKYFQDYIYYAIRNNYKLLRNASTGSTALPLLNKTDFDLLELPLHTNKDTQQKIASVLSALDSKIELNNCINAELEAMAKTIYDYWFVQFDFPYDFAQGRPDKNGKPYKSSGGKMVWNEVLKREVPEGWEVWTINDLLVKYSDKSKRIDSKQIKKQGKYPVITQDNGDFISGYTDEESPINDVPLIVFGDHSCTLRFVDFPFFRGADGTQLMIFENEILIYSFLSLERLLEQIPGYGKYERHYKYLKDFSIVIPSTQSLSTFNALINPIFKKISKNRFANEQLASLRDWLLPMLMNGQVRVR